MIMLDKERAGLWIKIGAIVIAASFIITLMPAVSGGDLGGFFKSFFQGTSGKSQDTESQARIIELKDAITKDPKDVASLVELGNLYYDAGKYSSAITYYQKSLDLDAANYDVMTDMGAAYHATGQSDKALEIFKAVVVAKPDHAMAWFNQGVVYNSKNDTPNMRFAWERFLVLQPTGDLADQVRQELKTATSGGS